MDFRYLCMLTHYRKQLECSLETLDAAKTAHERLKNKIIELKKDDSSAGNTEEYEKDFLNAINDDLNVPKALGILWEMLKNEALGTKERVETALKFDQVLGLNLEMAEEEKVDIPEDVQQLISKRNEARANKDFAESDRLRDEIKSKGFIIKDSKEGNKIEKA